MSDAVTAWLPQKAWDGHVEAGRHGNRSGEAGLHIETLDQALATIIVRAGETSALAQRMQTRFGLDLPGTGCAAFGPRGALLWSAPGQWLALAPARGMLGDLPATLADIAAVTDQTDGRALVRLSGTNVLDVLAKGFSIDLDPLVFKPGSVAVTSVAHLSVQIWRDERGFVIAVARSVAGSFWSWLMAASAEYGCEVAV